MASSVTLRLPPASLQPNRHKVTIAGYAGTVILSITRPEVAIDKLGDAWEETERVDAAPLLERAGRQLRTFTISALLTKEKTANPSGEPAAIDADLLVLASLATPISSDAVVVVAYDTLLPRLTRSGGWVITDFRVRSIRRRPSDNAVTRAELDLTFTESSRPPRPVRPITTSSAVASGAGPAPVVAGVQYPSAPHLAGGARRHTVKAGETLAALALLYYGNAAGWPYIANANGIRDPRIIAVPTGTILTIPG